MTFAKISDSNQTKDATMRYFNTNAGPKAEPQASPIPLTRRGMLQSGMGLGMIALADLLAKDVPLRAHEPDAHGPAGPHFTPKAKNIIFLFMAGGPSQVDTFDPKPDLAKLAGKDVPNSIAQNIPRIKRAGLKNLMASPYKFAQHGQSGIPVSDLFPAVAKQVDELCVIRSMHHRNPVHGPGECVMLTGTQLGDRPSMGAWVTYGLGSENQEMPGFVVMNVNTIGMQFAQAAGWETGFLPARFQGTVVNATRGISNIKMPGGYTESSRRRQLALLESLNRSHAEQFGEHSELEARIRSYEMAYRMQSSAPKLFDIAGETQATQTLYGLDHKDTAAMGRSCLLARRMVESGVRFVQIRFGGWDAHGNLNGNHRNQAKRTDVPVAALIADLRQRGLLDDTLVVWGGEFGRTPTMEGLGKGRDHSPTAFTCWLAGGGVQGGKIVGKTDPIGYTVLDRPVRPSDFHATMLHALGLDQHKLIYNHQGRNELATVLGGDIVHDVFA